MVGWIVEGKVGVVKILGEGSIVVVFIGVGSVVVVVIVIGGVVYGKFVIGVLFGVIKMRWNYIIVNYYIICFFFYINVLFY